MKTNPVSKSSSNARRIKNGISYNGTEFVFRPTHILDAGVENNIDYIPFIYGELPQPNSGIQEKLFPCGPVIVWETRIFSETGIQMSLLCNDFTTFLSWGMMPHENSNFKSDKEEEYDMGVVAQEFSIDWSARLNDKGVPSTRADKKAVIGLRPSLVYRNTNNTKKIKHAQWQYFTIAIGNGKQYKDYIQVDAPTIYNINEFEKNYCSPTQLNIKVYLKSNSFNTCEMSLCDLKQFKTILPEFNYNENDSHNSSTEPHNHTIIDDHGVGDEHFILPPPRLSEWIDTPTQKRSLAFNNLIQGSKRLKSIKNSTIFV